MRTTALLAAWFWMSLAAAAQTPARPEIDLDAFVQQLMAAQQEGAQYEDLYESLLLLYAHPLDLNTATRAELASVYVLSEAQINAFLAYRQQNGRLLSLYELQAVPGLDVAAIRRLLPFATVADDGTAADNRPLWQRLATERNHTLLLRYDRTLEQRRGFTEPDTAADGTPRQRYAGGPNRWLARYRIQHPGDFSLGLTLEKDAGETFGWQPGRHQYGADFVSGHFQLENKGRWKRIAVGDYQLQVGQGLLLSAGFAVGKGSETVETVRRTHLGIRPYTSVVEAGFLRGAAATYARGRWQYTGFVSRTRRAASLDDTDTLPEPFVASFLTAGLHRTPNEQAARSRILEQTAGTDITYRNAQGTFELGGTWLHTQFGLPLQRRPQRYNQFEFGGTDNTVAGLHYTFAWQNFNVFGEAARSGSGGIGAVNGVLASFSSRLSASVLWRHYDRHFHSFYGNAFGENTRNLNETGVYWGLKLNPWRRLTLTAYYDSYRFAWLKYRVDAPSDGFDYLVRLAWQPNKKLLLYAQYREEHKQRNEPEPATPIRSPVPVQRRQYLFNIDFEANDMLTLRSRAQFSTFDQPGRTRGYVLLQDLTLHRRRWQVSTRFALFDTDDYDNRQYVFEKDVLSSFSIPAYYWQGLRTYCVVNYDLTRRLSVWLRLARTTLTNQATIGSGLDEIDGPRRTDVRVQVRYQLGK